MPGILVPLEQRNSLILAICMPETQAVLLLLSLAAAPSFSNNLFLLGSQNVICSRVNLLLFHLLLWMFLPISVMFWKPDAWTTPFLYCLKLSGCCIVFLGPNLSLRSDSLPWVGLDQYLFFPRLPQGRGHILGYPLRSST